MSTVTTGQGSVTDSAATCSSALVVGDDDDTLLRLRDYLVRAGVQTRATRQLEDAWKSRRSQSIVLLPDFAAGEVTAGLTRLRRSRELTRVRSREWVREG